MRPDNTQATLKQLLADERYPELLDFLSAAQREGRLDAITDQMIDLVFEDPDIAPAYAKRIEERLGDILAEEMPAALESAVRKRLFGSKPDTYRTPTLYKEPRELISLVLPPWCCPFGRVGFEEMRTWVSTIIQEAEKGSRSEREYHLAWQLFYYYKLRYLGDRTGLYELREYEHLEPEIQTMLRQELTRLRELSKDIESLLPK